MQYIYIALDHEMSTKSNIKVSAYALIGFIKTRKTTKITGIFISAWKKSCIQFKNSFDIQINELLYETKLAKF